VLFGVISWIAPELITVALGPPLGSAHWFSGVKRRSPPLQSG